MKMPAAVTQIARPATQGREAPIERLAASAYTIPTDRP